VNSIKGLIPWELKYMTLKIVEKWEDLPTEVRDTVENELAQDILERYNQSMYHDEDIIHNTLAEFGLKLKD
jgi:hypothetical protein